MKRRTCIVAVLTLAVLIFIAIWVGISRPGTRTTASVALLGTTNTASGQRVALLAFTNPTPLAVVGIPHSVDYRIGDTWLTQQRVPGVVLADIASSADLSPYGSCVVAVRFPTNGSWRLRIRYHEQPRGLRGAGARATDFVLRLFTRSQSTAYTGQTYLAETPEIVN
jgi:hypothetical protein